MTVEVQAPGGDTAFIFENDVTLNCFPATSRDGGVWVIRTDTN